MRGQNLHLPRQRNRMKTQKILLSLLAAAPIWAAACGVCIEDKMAATYDHAAVTAAFKLPKSTDE